MTIDEAYKLLGLEPALEFEAKRLVTLHASPPVDANIDPSPLVIEPPVRGVGSTTRMLVMAALDVVVGGQRVMMRVATHEEQRRLRGELSRVIRTLGGAQKDVDRSEVVLIPQRVTLRREREYIDHWRDPLENDDRRIMGPLGWAYQTKDMGRSHLVYDRDGELLAEVTRAGLAELEEKHCVALILG